MPPAYSPALDLAKPTGRKPAAVTSVPVSIGNAVELQAKVAACSRSKSLLHLHHHHLDRDDGVVDQQAESDDQRAERDPMQVDAGRVHDDETRSPSTSGTESATMIPVRQPERKEAHDQHDGERLDEGPR